MARRAGSGLAFRAARAADLARLVAIHTAAFPDARREPERRTNFTHNVRGRLGDLVIAEREGEIVAHAFLFRSRGFFGRVEVPIGSIASVGVAQEARGTGVGKALVAELHRRASARGDAITLLYPFRTGFYAALGYGAVSAYRQLTIAPASIPRDWQKKPQNMAVLALRPGDRPAVEMIFREVAKKSTGRLSRTDAFWDRLFLDERKSLFVATRGETITGYLVTSLEQTEAHAKTTLVVHEIAATDDLTKRLLFGVMGAQKGQVTDVVLELDATDPIDRALVDPDAAEHGTLALEHPFGRVANGPMVRVCDAKRAIEARGYAADGHVVMKIEGEATFEITVAKGRAKTRNTREKPHISLDRAGLGTLLYGAIAPSDGAAIGRFALHDDPARLDAIFTLPPFFGLDPF